MTTHCDRIVLGVDGSESSAAAARWAAREALAREVPLRIVHAFMWPHSYHVGRSSVGTSTYRIMRERAETLLRETQVAIATQFPALHLDAVLVEHEPVAAIVEQSRSAALVVVGSRGLGGVSSMLLGSVAIGLAQASAAPLIVVRGDGAADTHPGNRPIVVGIDSSAECEPALDFALCSAAAHGAPLVAVHAWDEAMAGSGRELHLTSVPDRELQAESEVAVAEQLAGWREKFPDVEINQIVRMGRPAHLLLEHARTAQLVVVGSRGRGGVTGLLLGSTSQTLLHHSPCPVAVVRRGADH